MSQSPPPSHQHPDQVVVPAANQIKQDPARDTDLPQLNNQDDAHKQAHMVAAGLAAISAVQILKREEEAASAPLVRASSASSTNRDGPSLPASIFAWAFLLIIGLGSITGMVAIIIAMLR